MICIAPECIFLPAMILNHLRYFSFSRPQQKTDILFIININNNSSNNNSNNNNKKKIYIHKRLKGLLYIATHRTNTIEQVQAA